MIAAILVAPDVPPPMKFYVFGPESPLVRWDGTADYGLFDLIFVLRFEFKLSVLNI